MRGWPRPLPVTLRHAQRLQTDGAAAPMGSARDSTARGGDQIDRIPLVHRISGKCTVVVLREVRGNGTIMFPQDVPR